MYAEDIQNYLKDLSNDLNKQKSAHVHINSSIRSRTNDHTLDVQVTDKIETLDIKVVIPLDRATPATIKLTNQDEHKNIDAKIGNSRNVSLEHDINFISQIIVEAITKEDAVEYLTNKLIEVFNKTEAPKKQFKDTNKKTKEGILLGAEQLPEIISKANFKGANIVSWKETPNNKITLIYKNKESENYGSKAETNTHLYYAYLLKNKYPSKRIF